MDVNNEGRKKVLNLKFLIFLNFNIKLHKWTFISLEHSEDCKHPQGVVSMLKYCTRYSIHGPEAQEREREKQIVLRVPFEMILT